MTVTIKWTFAPNTTLEQMIAAELAGVTISKVLDDKTSKNFDNKDLEVNLYFMNESLASNVIGGSIPGIQAEVPFTQVYNLLLEDQDSEADNTALEKTLPSVSVDKVNLTNANAKAIGLTGNSLSFDGIVMLNNTLNSNYKLNYGNETSLASNDISAVSVLVHEIIHSLGFIHGEDNLEGNTLLDLFRTSLNGNALGDNMSGTDEPFFSFDGTTNLGSFSDIGIYQGSHWEDSSNPIGIMGPTITPGIAREIKEPDLLALDSIGWDLRKNVFENKDNKDQYKQDYRQDPFSKLEKDAYNVIEDKFKLDRWENTQWQNAKWEDIVADPNTFVPLLTTPLIDTNNNGVHDPLDQMLTDSKVYNWGGGGWGQLISQQEVYFDSLDIRMGPDVPQEILDRLPIYPVI